jgi:hypothetical protein
VEGGFSTFSRDQNDGLIRKGISRRIGKRLTISPEKCIDKIR